MEEVGLDPVVLAFAVGVSALTGFLFGSIPVLSLTRGNLSSPIKAGGRGAGGSKKRFRVRTLFAVIQVGMVLVLSVASGLMVRTFQELNAVQPGFEDPEEVLTFRLATPASEIPDIDEAVHTLQAVLERIQALPGVTSASGAASVAMEGWESWDNWMVEEFPLPRGGTSPSRRINWMIPGYHETIQDRLLAGRSIEWADIYERRNVALVTESFAREYWGEPGAALGKRIRNSDSSPWREIVGVVGNVYTRGVASDPPLVIYLPFITADFWDESSFSFRDLRYVVRTDRPDPLTLLPAVRDATWSVNRNLAIADVITLDRIYGKSIARTSFSLVMLGIAAGVAMILGMVGVYGVVSFIVSQRTREMGIRMALGANRAQVKGMVLKQGGTIALVGTGLGLMSAAFLTGIMASLLYGVSPLDPLTYAVVSGVLSAVVLMASYIPARRASRVDPTDALRWE
jgi:predicted permease